MENDLIFRYRTKNESTPYGKPRVFFTCHPLDFDSVFDQICSDIFETQDCTVFYSKDMKQALSTEIREKVLSNINLFLIPITAKLLTEPNRALDDDFRFAIEHNIPVLPIIMETGIDYLYSKIDAISKYQYLNKASTDITEIEYKTKLKRFLEDILLNDNKIEQIRKSFSAYFFLSYRKKDRDKANALIQLIHELPDYWDIAIWYDEYILFGSDFYDGIIDALTKSNLFILLITPNILQKTGYDYNFVVREEYPLAVKKGKAILPVIAEKTNLQELNSLFPNIPSAVSIHDKDSVRDSLNRYLPCHNSEETQQEISKKFNLGLAYLNGVDVEINSKRGIALITEAAEAGSTEAAYQLYRIYTHAIGTNRDYAKAFDWITRLTLFLVKEYGTLSKHTRPIILIFIDAAVRCGKYDIAKTVTEKVYSLPRRIWESHIPFLSSA